MLMDYMSDRGRLPARLEAWRWQIGRLLREAKRESDSSFSETKIREAYLRAHPVGVDLTPGSAFWAKPQLIQCLRYTMMASGTITHGGSDGRGLWWTSMANNAPDRAGGPKIREIGDDAVEFDGDMLRAAVAALNTKMCAAVVMTRWRVGNVTDMSGLFRGWDTLDQALEWDVSRVTTMDGMFDGCAAFNQELRWDTKRCVSFKGMFAGCVSLTRTIHLNCSALARGCLALGLPTGLAARLVLTNVPEGLVLSSDETLAVRRGMVHTGPVYTLGPNRGRCHGQSLGSRARVQVRLYHTSESRSPVLHELREAVRSGRITGTRPLPAASAWPPVVGPNRGGKLCGVRRMCLDQHTNPANDTADTLVVARSMGAEEARYADLQGGALTRSRKRELADLEDHRAAGAAGAAGAAAPITAFVRVDVSNEPKDLVVNRTPARPGGESAHESWRTSMAYVPLVMSSIDAPAGHAAEALAATLQLAKRGKQMLVLSAAPSAVLWYLNTCFLSDTHQVVLNTRESFEQTRAYALSEREGVDLEGTLARALSSAALVVVAFVFGTGGATGRAVLSGMDYSGLRHRRPSDLGRNVRMFRVSAETPLVRRCSYELMRYPESDGDGRGRGRRGYMLASEDADPGAARRYGPVRLAGEFVELAGGGGVAIFKTGGTLVRISTEDAGFRRTFKSHEDDDSVPHIGVEPEDPPVVPVPVDDGYDSDEEDYATNLYRHPLNEHKMVAELNNIELGQLFYELDIALGIGIGVMKAYRHEESLDERIWERGVRPLRTGALLDGRGLYQLIRADTLVTELVRRYLVAAPKAQYIRNALIAPLSAVPAHELSVRRLMEHMRSVPHFSG
jgi:hypothetical protein